MVATSIHSRRRRHSPAGNSTEGQIISQTLNLYLHSPITSIEGAIELWDFKEIVTGSDYRLWRRWIDYFRSPAMESPGPRQRSPFILFKLKLHKWCLSTVDGGETMAAPASGFQWQSLEENGDGERVLQNRRVRKREIELGWGGVGKLKWRRPAKKKTQGNCL